MDAINQFIAQNEPALRLEIFLCVLALMAALEAVLPRRAGQNRPNRWPTNLGLVLIDTGAVRAVAWAMPLFLPVAAAEYAGAQPGGGWGLLPAVGIGGWAAFILGILILDLAIYAQHLIFHKVPVLWRLHRVHHTDMALDVTSGFRFHPVEILLSVAIKTALVVALGIPGAAVVVFEVILNATALFNHANLRLTPKLDAAIRLVLVTPDMHRVHHSVHRDETDSNFGFNVPWWDRLFGTYRAQPRAGHQDMQIGISEFRDADNLRLRSLLTQPLRKD